jgi:hypothetical protein
MPAVSDRRNPANRPVAELLADGLNGYCQICNEAHKSASGTCRLCGEPLSPIAGQTLERRDGALWS